jgi:hydrogenase maturation protease
MNPPWAVVIGVGNEFRHDDGIGPALATEVRPRNLPGIRVLTTDGEPIGLLDAWADVTLAVVVDAVLCEPAMPGWVHRTTVDELPPLTGAAGTHGFGIPETVELVRVLDRMPQQLIVYAVEASDVSLGLGLSAPVARALPALVGRRPRRAGPCPGVETVPHRVVTIPRSIPHSEAEVGEDRLIRGKQGHPIDDRLRNDDPIERVPRPT